MKGNFLGPELTSADGLEVGLSSFLKPRTKLSDIAGVEVTTWVGFGVAVLTGVGEGVRVGVAVIVGDEVGVGVFVGLGVWVGVGVGVTSGAEFSVPFVRVLKIVKLPL